MDFKNLDKYRTGGSGSRLQLSIPVPRTAAGRVYRYSPFLDLFTHDEPADLALPEEVTS